MASNTIKNPNHMFYYHEMFKRGRPDLLPRIKRSTRGVVLGDGGISKWEDREEVERLRRQVEVLKGRMASLTSRFEKDLERLEGRFERRIASILLTRGSGSSSSCSSSTCQESCVRCWSTLLLTSDSPGSTTASSAEQSLSNAVVPSLKTSSTTNHDLPSD